MKLTGPNNWKVWNECFIAEAKQRMFGTSLILIVDSRPLPWNLICGTTHSDLAPQERILVRNGIFIFYVDDIVVAYKKDEHREPLRTIISNCGNGTS